MTIEACGAGHSDWEAITAAGAFLAAAISAFFCWRTGATWRQLARETAENECLLLIENLKGAVGRFKSQCEQNHMDVNVKWTTYHSAWDANRQLRMKLAVVRRYRAMNRIEEKFQAVLHPMRQMSNAVENPNTFFLASATDAVARLGEALAEEFKFRSPIF